ncbi:MAG: hypothetical protein KDH08_01960 [Anaerolineae bacterium]|nr:hypothetical protein [Anaerolineae bacterium]
MNAKVNTGRQDYQHGVGSTLELTSESGDRLVIAISATGLTVIQAEALDDRTTIGSIVVSGLTAEQATKQSKGFWGKLWDKIKKVAGDVIDAFTFEAGPFTFRPTATVGFQDGKVISVTVGLNCND